jgi:hypothetical protein
MTLAAAVNAYFADFQHIIATTKSHQIAKGDKWPCDRFRVIIPWASTITNVAIYETTMAKSIDEYYADPACKDAARFFFPCKEIVSVNFDHSAYKLHPVRKVVEPVAQDTKGVVGSGYSINYIRKILRSGTIENRNVAIYKMSCEFSKLGYTQQEVFDIFKKHAAVFRNFVNFPDKRLRNTISNAYNR